MNLKYWKSTFCNVHAPTQLTPAAFLSSPFFLSSVLIHLSTCEVCVWQPPQNPPLTMTIDCALSFVATYQDCRVGLRSNNKQQDPEQKHQQVKFKTVAKCAYVIYDKLWKLLSLLWRLQPVVSRQPVSSDNYVPSKASTAEASFGASAHPPAHYPINKVWNKRKLCIYRWECLIKNLFFCSVVQTRARWAL